jgi:hypothetical protein
MRDFGVKLDAKAPTVTHPGDGSVGRAGDLDIAGWQTRDVVTVTHPDIQGCRQVAKER